MYFRLDESAIVDSEEIKPVIIIDYDKDENIVGVEILGLSKRVSKDMLKSFNSVHYAIAAIYDLPTGFIYYFWNNPPR